MIVADRTRTLAGLGRNLESPKPHANALSGVQKDNLVAILHQNISKNVGVHPEGSCALRSGASHNYQVVAFARDRTDKHCPTCICDETDDVFNENPEETDDHCQTCTCNKGKPIAICDSGLHRQKQIRTDILPPLRAGRGCDRKDTVQIYDGTKIRRLTPRECERLQGFPDDFTKYGISEKGEKVEISDTQRYRMMGNAVTVSVVEFIARRLPA